MSAAQRELTPAIVKLELETEVAAYVLRISQGPTAEALAAREYFSTRFSDAEQRAAAAKVASEAAQ